MKALPFLFFYLISPAFSAPSPLKTIELAEDARDVTAPALTNSLNSDRPAVRARVALAFGRIQKPEGIEPLLKLLDDTNLFVKKTAAFSLGQLGWVSQSAAGREQEISDHLVGLMVTPEKSVRRVVVEALGKIAQDKTPERVISYLKDVDSKVRAETLLALYRYRLILTLKNPKVKITPLSDQDFTAILALAQDHNPLVRRNVAYYINRTQDSRGLATALELAKDKYLWSRLFAIQALSKIGKVKAVPTLIQACSDRAYFVRVEAINGLFALKSLQQIPADTLTNLANDRSFHVRAALAQALSDEKSDDIILKKLYLDSSRTVRAEALGSLVTRNPKDAEKILEAAYQSRDWVIRQKAIDLSTVLGDARENLSLHALEDQQILVRMSALNSLSGIKTKTAYDGILSRLNADVLSERDAAAGALAGRSETDAPTKIWSTYLRSSEKKWITLRVDCLDYLNQTVTPETVGYLQIAAKDQSPAVAQHAIDLMRARGVTDLPQPPKSELTYSPYRGLAVKRNPRLILDTTRGQMEVELFHHEAEIHVATIVGFAEQGGYDGLLWHRVVTNFVIQGGDPEGTGGGDVGFNLRAEINGRHYARGTLGMPRNQDFDTGGVQLFFTHIPTPNLDGQYTVLGQVRRGQNVIDRIEMGDRILKATVIR